ncbi:hypothetical protein EKO29_11630 [Colwellia sp. Arc7-635]|uniref:hypothetical protein n=1 Tax=Colwellia sp. Arc7-635 TaxID=2497879 RepID=UPI000F85A8D3|nr:hypothetical protein [Colwellia sp. Arc7-635]AZQ84607.1 hypothetical protein EKO29_11630 [Colwellia sp. Arc7-635]
MSIIINKKEIKSPIAIALMVLFALSIVGGIVAFILFVLLPLIGIVLSGIMVLMLAIITPIILWFILPIIFISIIGWFFGELSK